MVRPTHGCGRMLRVDVASLSLCGSTGVSEALLRPASGLRGLSGTVAALADLDRGQDGVTLTDEFARRRRLGHDHPVTVDDLDSSLAGGIVATRETPPEWRSARPEGSYSSRQAWERGQLPRRDRRLRCQPARREQPEQREPPGWMSPPQVRSLGRSPFRWRPIDGFGPTRRHRQQEAAPTTPTNTFFTDTIFLSPEILYRRSLRNRYLLVNIGTET